MSFWSIMIIFQLFLHSMPADCYFNIFGFGSSFTSVFGTSVKYDDESLKKAKAHARGNKICPDIHNLHSIEISIT